MVGKEGCYLDGTDYFTVPLQDDDLLVDGFSFVLDLQTDEPVEQIVFGNRENDRTAVLLTANADGQAGRLGWKWAMTRAGCSSQLPTHPLRQGSASSHVKPEKNEMLIAEIQPWGSDENLQVSCDRLTALLSRALAGPFVVGGISDMGLARGTFTGRLANFAVFPQPLDPGRIRITAALDGTNGGGPSLSPPRATD